MLVGRNVSCQAEELFVGLTGLAGMNLANMGHHAHGKTGRHPFVSRDGFGELQYFLFGFVVVHGLVDITLLIGHLYRLTLMIL